MPGYPYVYDSTTSMCPNSFYRLQEQQNATKHPSVVGKQAAILFGANFPTKRRHFVAFCILQSLEGIGFLWAKSRLPKNPVTTSPLPWCGLLRSAYVLSVTNETWKLLVVKNLPVSAAKMCRRNTQVGCDGMIGLASFASPPTCNCDNTLLLHNGRIHTTKNCFDLESGWETDRRGRKQWSTLLV